jgi:hypothetical protein
LLAAWLAVLAGAGCGTVASLPEVDLDEPGWTVWSGQAVWRSAADRPPLAGELIVARHDDGDVLVSFSKPPLPIFTAQSVGRLWRIDFVERGRSYSGRGRPPRRFVWFRLPNLIGDGAAPEGWRVEGGGDRDWSLRHPGRGESIRVVLDP